MTVSTGRQLATGLAAFFVTTLLVLANAPEQPREGGLRIERAALAPAGIASDRRG